MTTTEAALRVIYERLVAACKADAELREAVGVLTAGFIDASSSMDRSTGEARESTGESVPSVLGPSPVGDFGRSNREGPMVGAVIAERLRGLDPKDSLAEQIDLGILARRLRMKSDGSRWAARRRRLLDDPSVDYESQVEPDDREIIRRAKEIPGCFLWTNSPNSPCPHDLSAFDVLAECYANAAAAVELVHRLDEQRVPFSDPALQKAFQLLGEAQSALRVAVANAGGPEDSDQFLVFQWLKANTRDREIYVARHMRISDPADPAAWPDLAERIAELGRLVEIGRLESGS